MDFSNCWQNIKEAQEYDKELYKRRNEVERFFSDLKASEN